MAFIDIVSTLCTPKKLMLAAMGISFACKLFFLCSSVRYFFKAPQHRLLHLFLMIFLLGTLMTTVCPMGGLLLRGILALKEDFPLFTLLCRIDWVFFITYYQALALFFEYLLNKKIKFGPWHLVNGCINLVLASCFTYLAFFNYAIPSSSPTTLFFELKLIQVAFIYLPFLFLPVAYSIIKKIRSQEVPIILVHQLKYLMYFFIPYVVMETANHHCSYLGTFVPFIFPYKYLLFTITTILSTIAIYVLSKKIMGFRFLNIRKDVASHDTFNFLVQFKDILEQVSYATALHELGHLTQTFYKRAFHIPLSKTALYIRRKGTTNGMPPLKENSAVMATVESFLTTENETLLTMFSSLKILIRDEIHFSHFYDNDPVQGEILQFLDAIHADIFLPIYERETMIAYIIIDRHARISTLFTNKERDEMLVFTTYLSNIITIVTHSTLEALQQRYKSLTDELYHKHQEINQYKESIRSFMRAGTERKIGILYYKNRRFMFANEAAHEFIDCDPNTHKGHRLTQALTSVAHRVEEYKTSQTTFSHDSKGNKIIIAGMCGPDQTPTLLIYHPDISDSIKANLDQLKDPSAWDYLLYLETTAAGQIINQLIPSTSEKLLTFKMNLLAAALSKKAALLHMPDEDLHATVEIFHAISARQILHTIKMTRYEKSNDVALALFGISPLLQAKAAPPLLEKLNTIGTLFIENIEYLSLDTQEQLAHFISLGYYTAIKSDQKKMSNVRILCSTTKNLLTLVDEGTFSKSLYDELKQTSLTQPSLNELSDSEMHELTQGFADQVITDDTYKNLLALTGKDKIGFLQERPLNLREYKEKVLALIKEKSTKHHIEEMTEFDAAYTITDPTIAHAVRLGKKALKDPQAMALLWNKFKNQNKIAQLLGVNRSSVNRRCHEYNLIPTSPTEKPGVLSS